MLNRLIAFLTISLLAFTANAQEPSPLEIELEPFISGLSNPVGLEHAGDERLFVIQKNSGIIEIYNLDGDFIGDFLDIDGLSTASEQGLLGLAFHPDYQENGRFFVNYTDGSGDTVISEFTVSSDPDVADDSSEQILLEISQPFSNHNGGGLEFGPDGYLYIGTGDGGSGGDPQNNAQDPQELLGKMLRIDVDSGDPYGIPADNPFVDDASTLDEIWAIGMRNPWRYTFDDENGDLWTADVGQNQWEEINVEPGDSEGGLNYGWRCYEASYEYNTDDCSGDFFFPIAEYSHSGDNFCSITGGIVYRGSQFPRLFGHYFFTDYCAGDIISLVESEEGSFEENTLLETSTFGYVAFAADINGQPYIVDINGNVQKIVDPCGDFDPEISANVDFNAASASEGAQYYWYLNGELVEGENDQVFAPSENGEVYAVVENEDGCAIQTNTVDLTNVSVEENTKGEIKVYPNPTSDSIFVEGVEKNSRLEIVNSAGQIIEVQFNFQDASRAFADVSNLPSGMYFIRVQGSDSSVVTPFSKR
ncbi:PQQ-dependent sugar dehydrogenase [Halocola ammonii]